MSDFFSDLMARIDGTAAVLRPRLPSLFETPATQAPFPVEPEVPVDAVERKNPSAPQAAPPPEPAPAQAAPPPYPFRPAMASSSPRAVEAASPVRTEMHSRETRETRRETVRSATPPAFRSAENGRNAADAQDQARLPGRTAESETPRTVERVTSAPVAPVQPATTTATVPPPFAPAPPKLRANLPPRAEAAKREAEPPIQISIGRIEIRATSDAPRPAKGSKPSPVMSLDEYLRSRSR